jgi:hypothetical protein
MKLHRKIFRVVKKKTKKKSEFSSKFNKNKNKTQKTDIDFKCVRVSYILYIVYMTHAHI